MAGGVSEHAYIRDTFQVERVAASGLRLASMDASVDYAMFGDVLAPQLRAQFPWLKLVFVLRERIGRAMSWKNMLSEKFDRGCKGSNKAKCLAGSLRSMNYTGPLEAWLREFPADQIFIMQFEALATDPGPELRRLKQFLGLSMTEPEEELRNVNSRPGSKGWPMTRDEYKGLIDESRRDAQDLLDLLEAHDLADKASWLPRWEAVWQRNLDTCDSQGNCLVSSS